MKNKTYIIAEIGQAHDGSLGILHSYIDALAETGINAIKFQTHIAEAESSQDEPFRIPFSYEDKTRYAYWQRMSFSFEQWLGIKDHCERKNVDFLSSPFSQAAVDLLEKINVKSYKIGSGEVTNHLLLEKVGLTKKPVILSSGMSDYNELNQAVMLLKKHGNTLSILQCTTAYPTPLEKVGLNVIAELKARYPGVKIGLSDHSSKVETSIAAVALGAEILEFHAVFDKRMFGPDTTSSLSIDEIAYLIKAVRNVEKILAHPVNKFSNSDYVAAKRIFEKSLAVNKELPIGHELKFEDLEAKKPSGNGIPASEYQRVIGKKLRNIKEKYTFLKETDL